MTDQDGRIATLLERAGRYMRIDIAYLADAGVWSSLNVVIVSVFALVLSVVFANRLPPDVFGTYQYLLSLSSLLTALCLTGMNSAIVQAVARGFEGDLRAAVSAQLVWNIIPTLVGLAGALYYLANGNMVLALGVAIVAIFTPAINAFNSYAAFLQGKREFKQQFFYLLGITIAYYGCMLPIAAFSHDIVLLIFTNLAVNAAATAFFYYRTLRAYAPGPETDPETVSYGAHLSVMGSIGTIASQLDSVLVFHFLGPAQLAMYNFASLIPERVAALFKFVTSAALPRFSIRTREELLMHMAANTAKAALAGAALATVYALAAPFVFALLFPQYAAAVPYSQFYALIIITVAANLPPVAIVALRMQRELYLFNISMPVILLGLQVALLFRFGIIGILAARVVANAIGIIFALYLLHFPLKTSHHAGSD